MALTLYDLQEEEQRLEKLLDRMLTDSEGEVTQEIEEYFEDSTRVKELLSEKLDGYFKVLKNLDNYAEGCEKEEASFKEKGKKARKAQEFLEDRIKAYMEANNIKSIKTPHTEFKINGPYGQAPVITIGQMPPEFCKFKITLEFEGDETEKADWATEIALIAERDYGINVKLDKKPILTKLREHAEKNHTQSLVTFGERKTKLVY